MRGLLPEDYPGLLQGIKDRVRSAQYAALKAVNKEMIAERQKGDTWGRAVVERLASELREEFSGMQRFSGSNQWRIKMFFQIYASKEKLAPMVQEIGWAHNTLIFERCKDDHQRELSIRMTRKFGWRKNVLVRYIENQSYEETLLSQTSFDKTLPKSLESQAKLVPKDEYTFDSLELSGEHSERDLGGF